MNLQALEIFKQSEHWRQQRNWLNHELRPVVCLKMASLSESEAESLLELYTDLIGMASNLRSASHYMKRCIFGARAEEEIAVYNQTLSRYNYSLETFKAIMGVTC